VRRAPNRTGLRTRQWDQWPLSFLPVSDHAEHRPALKLVATVPSSAEAVIVAGELEAVGIRAIPEPSTKGGSVYGAPVPLDIFVEEQDLDRAQEVLDAQPMSEEELLDAEKQPRDGGR